MSKSRLIVLLVAVLAGPAASAGNDHAERRLQLVREIAGNVRQTSAWIGKSELDGRVMAVMAKVARHEFVPPGLRPLAYLNRPLPVGHGQTVSQPYMVALMTDLVKVDEDDTVLEIGTGVGYQAAILAELAKKVYSVEIIAALEAEASERLKRLGYTNVETRVGDGYYGWSDHAPFDAIIVTAAPTHVPPPLLKQLKPGGRMAIPVGGPFTNQRLLLVEKALDGRIKTRNVLPVIFSPLAGGERI